jgi:LPS export ABC transporter protein LptC
MMSRKHARTRRPALVLALVLGMAGGAVACSSESQVATVPDAYLTFDADGIVFQMTHRITQDGRLQGLVQADTAIQWQDSSAIHLRVLELTVLEESGEVRAIVTARRGVLDTRSNRMTAYGNVVMIVPGQNRRLESEELHYDPQGDRIRSDSAFVFTEGTRVTRGRAFRSDLDFRNFEIIGRGGG